MLTSLGMVPGLITDKSIEQMFDPPLPPHLAFHLSITDSALVLLLRTLEPTSLSQPSRLQLECSVPLLHHASRANETAHSAASAPFNARLMVGLSPWRRWRKSVKARTRRVRRETVRSYWLLAVGHGRGWEKRTRMNVQGKVYPSFLSSRRK